MNNMFLEGPLQTGKSTLLRRVLREYFGSELDRVSGFTSQRITDSDGQLLGFRLAPAAADISIAVDRSAADLSGLNNVFKNLNPGSPRVDMSVFENAGVSYINEALNKAKAGMTSVILLDEIGGHELASDIFRDRLYELLDSEYICVGVIKSPENTRRMDSKLMQLNEELHRKVSFTSDRAEYEASLRRILDSI